MSIQGLENPFQRLAALPTTMNWRGTWVNDETYFQNDVVVSPINAASYILPNTTTTRGGPDPSLNPLFIELSPTSTGIVGITPGGGIGVDNTNPQQPVVSNLGVITVTAGVGIDVDNTDPQNIVINSTGVETILPGAGIQITGSQQLPTIINAGVRQVTPGTGIQLSNNTGVVQITNAGLISVLPGTGIDVGLDTHNVTITNTGVVDFQVVGGGLQRGGTAANRTIQNTGVLSVTALDNSIQVDNTNPQTPILYASSPQITKIFAANPAGYNNWQGVIPPNGIVPIGVTISPGIFQTYLASGAPNPNGVFIIDMAQYTANFLAAAGGSPNVIANTFSFTFEDVTTVGGPYEYISAVIVNNQSLVAGIPYTGSGINTSITPLYFNVADARTAGLRTLNIVHIRNNTNGNMQIVSFNSLVTGSYYPNGLE